MNSSRRLIFVSAYPLTGFGGGIASSRAFYSAFREIFSGPIVLISSESDRTIITMDYREMFVGVPKAHWEKRVKLVIGGRALDRMSPEADDWLMANLEPEDILAINGAVAGRLCKIGRDKGLEDIILIHHNIEVDFFDDNCPRCFGRSWMRKIIERNQIRGYRTARINFFLTDNDCERCCDLYGRSSNTAVLPTVLPPDLSTLPTLREGLDFRHGLRILMTGSLNTLQFENSLLAFLRDHWTEFLLRFPGSTITVAGKAPSTRLLAAAGSYCFTLISDPLDMGPFYEGCNVYLSLTDGGSGKKYRLMDALRHGLPIVTHIKGLSGYEDLSVSPWLFSFSNGSDVLRTLSEVTSRGVIGLHERKYIQNSFEEKYSFQQGVNITKSLLSALPWKDRV